MSVIASQITSLTIVYSMVYSDADQRKHQSSASLAFFVGNSPGPVNSPHKGPVTRKMFPFDDVIMLMIFRASMFLNMKLEPTMTSSPRRRSRGLHNPDSSHDPIQCKFVRNFTNIMTELHIYRIDSYCPMVLSSLYICDVAGIFECVCLYV